MTARTTPREHGTFACYKFGEHGGDHRNGCRCADCRAANTAYYHERKRRVAPAYVGADEVRRHIAWLAEHGVGLKSIAPLTGVSHGTLTKLVYGVSEGPGRKARRPSKRVRKTTRDAIMALSPHDERLPAGTRIPAAPVWVTVRTLLSRGWTKAAIAHAIGQNGTGLQLGEEFITRGNARAIRALLDQPVPEGVGKAWSAHHRASAPIEADCEEEPERTPWPIAPFLLEDEDARAWRARSACRRPEVPTYLFYPGRADTGMVAAARAVCATCPVTNECLQYALDHDEPGIWGGTSEKQRRSMRRQRRRVA